MISVEEALEKILGCVDTLGGEQRSLLDSMGQVLAQDIHSAIDIPPLDNSAMDGYAVRAEDTNDAGQQSPHILRVIDTVMAGHISQREVKPNTAIRIMTGAPVPGGADAVVKFEDTDETERTGSSGEIGILCPVEAGKNIRLAGEDIARGSLVLAKGTVVWPPEVGVLASLGMDSVEVIRRPTVAILSTGDELVEAGQPLPPGKIYNSNTYSTAAVVRYYGAIPSIIGVALDSQDSLMGLLEQGLDADMLITTGGVSMGDYDVVKDVLAKEGEMIFWRVRMKPGKPIAFGKLKGMTKDGIAKNILHLGLPGNPVSAMITFELFARPAILKMMGRQVSIEPVDDAILEEVIVNGDGRRVYARAIVEKRGDKYFARLTGPQGSGILTSMSSANALVIVPEDKPRVEKGDKIKFSMLSWKERSQWIDS